MRGPRVGRRRSLLSAAALAAALAAAGQARADAGAGVPDADASVAPSDAGRDRARLLDHTAHALRRGEVRLGLTHWAVGVVDELTVGTLVLPYLLPAASDLVSVNLFVESAFWRNDRHALAAHAGLLLGWPKGAGVDGAFWVVPLTLRYSFRLADPVSLHAGAGYTGVLAGAGVQSADYDVEGNAAAPLVRVEGGVEWRLDDTIAILGTVAWVPWAGDAVGAAQVRFGPAISGRGEIAVSTEELQNAWAVVAALVISAGLVDLRIGFGYGDVFPVDTGLVAPFGDFFPELALDVRF